MTDELRVLDLFRGIGGFSLGLERTGGFETVAFCEWNKACRRVLRKGWPAAQIFEDIRDLTSDDLGPIDVICGGYPCQPFSLAGKRRGAEDDRHLWPEMYRLVDELRPSWVIGENVVGHVNMGLDDVLSDLETAGYAARPFIIPAVAVDAKHRRDRLWIVAHSDRKRRDGGPAEHRENRRRVPTRKGEVMADPAGDSDVADAERKRQSGPRESQHACYPKADGEGKTTEPLYGRKHCVWPPEPCVGRVADGIPGRMDRLKQLGNAVVPQIPEIIGRAILEAETTRCEVTQ